MSLTEDEVIQILKLVEQSSFGELRLETADLKLLVRKKGYVASDRGLDLETRNPGTVPNLTLKPAVEPPVSPAETVTASKQAPAGQEGALAIKSPMLGTVYLRPSPDSPHYVEVGSYVKEHDTVCLIEVMKVFTAVKAGVNGYISEVLVESNEMVEYGQQLFLVKPDTEPAGKD